MSRKAIMASKRPRSPIALRSSTRICIATPSLVNSNSMDDDSSWASADTIYATPPASTMKPLVKSDPELDCVADTICETPPGSATESSVQSDPELDCAAVVPDIPPEPVTSNVDDDQKDNTWNRVIKVKLEEVESSLKKENENSALAEREELRRKRLTWNRDPCDKNRGRAVFRRGCAKFSITTALGGAPCHPSPIVQNIPRLLGYDTNPFIEQGQYYFAGRTDFNPWTPKFPGDIGLVESWVVCEGQRPVQEMFHMFLQCGKKSFEPHYHGPDAKGKYLYLGRYRRVPLNDDEVQETFRRIPYQALGHETQKAIADYYSRCRENDTIHLENPDGSMRDLFLSATDAHYSRAEAEMEGDEPGSWEKASDVKRKMTAFIALFLEHDYQVKIVPVEFVDYDEDLYRFLVECGASNGRVSINEAELGPL